ncbi:MAG: PhoX family protein, partial [Myxococcota bacterium]|nr:PhoX family protein [Myxococcota bacterium]
RSLIADIGPLGAADANGVRLPAGFTSRVIARAGQVVAGTSYEWHRMPDGGVTYGTEDGGWIYVSNSEIPLIGGVGAIRFDAAGEITSAYRTLDRTQVNCAGGKTPWHTWLSCEEIARGRVFETDPWGETDAIVRPALGVFKHEAATVDPVRAHVYLTEDDSEGRFYRFVPDAMMAGGHPDLNSGRLEVAVVAGDDTVTWVELPDPQFTGAVPTRMQIAESTRFRGGEGIWFHEDVVYFTTKGDNRVWAYDVLTSRISTIYDGGALAEPGIVGVDNIAVTCCGDVLVAEDGGSMQIVAILPDSGELRPIMQIVGHDGSEVTGPAFDPSGTRLYFSSQRGEDGGVTFEVTGPFHEPA